MQDAVAALVGGAAEAAGRARERLRGVSDLERAVARLHASTVWLGKGAGGKGAKTACIHDARGKMGWRGDGGGKVSGTACILS